MNCRLLIGLWALSFLATYSSIADPAVAPMAKKGVGYWIPKNGKDGLKTSGAAWCYDWAIRPAGVLPDGVEFVPMVWNEKSVNTDDLKTARVNGKALLGFNEPDVKNQANMTVEQALTLWPQLEATGMRLGSPATSAGAASITGWFRDFMNGARTNGYRIDFVCVHHYAGNYAPAAADLKRYLQGVYDLYKKPVWLTEFALSNWKTPATSSEQEAYIKEVVPMLESLPFVERYAWFALPPFQGDGGALAYANLCDEEGVPNACGVAYRDAK